MNVDSATITRTSQSDGVITPQTAAAVVHEDTKSFKEELNQTLVGKTIIAEEIKNQESKEKMNQGIDNANRVKEKKEMTSIADLNGATPPMNQSGEKMTNNINNNLDLSNQQKFSGEMASKSGQQSFAQVQQEAQKSLDNKQSVQNADLPQTAQQTHNNAQQNLSVQQSKQDVITSQTLQDNNIDPQTGQIKASVENVKNNLAGQVQKDKNTKSEISSVVKPQNKDISESLDELSSKIATINELKTSASLKTYTVTKSKDSKSDSDLKIKMDNNDITFFINLAQNQGVSASASAAANFANLSATKDTPVPENAQVTSQSIQVSQTLLNALNDSLQTNKPFRIDFGGDVSVIMKVDKNGNLSANFIPGSAAVENYLRNNIEMLRQNFDNQSLPYNELTYSNRQKQDQQHRNNKENDDE